MCMCNFACKGRPRNDLFCVGWDVKPYSLTHPVCSFNAVRLYNATRLSWDFSSVHFVHFVHAFKEGRRSEIAGFELRKFKCASYLDDDVTGADGLRWRHEPGVSMFSRGAGERRNYGNGDS